MYNIDMRRETDTLKGFTIIETMLFLALTGLMLVGAMVGIGTNLSRTRYRDTVEDIATMLRTQYDQVNRTQIQLRDDTGMCDMLTGSYNFDKKANIGRGRSNCDIYGVAVIFGADDKINGNVPGRIVQTNNILGKDILALEDEILSASSGDSMPPDPKEEIAKMSDQELLKALGLNNVVNRNGVCETVNVLNRKLLNWGATIEDEYHDITKAILLIIRSPRDGTVHTYVYDFTGNENLFPLDYSVSRDVDCSVVMSTESSIDINDALNNADPTTGKMRFSNKKDFSICIASDDAISIYGRRRMITIKADGHNSSAVVLVDMESEDNKCL